jgi:hypothetical protein
MNQKDLEEDQIDGAREGKGEIILAADMNTMRVGHVQTRSR